MSRNTTLWAVVAVVAIAMTGIVSIVWAKPDNSLLLISAIIGLVTPAVGGILAYKFDKQNGDLSNQVSEVRDIVNGKATKAQQRIDELQKRNELLAEALARKEEREALDRKNKNEPGK